MSHAYHDHSSDDGIDARNPRTRASLSEHSDDGLYDDAEEAAALASPALSRRSSAQAGALQDSQRVTAKTHRPPSSSEESSSTESSEDDSDDDDDSDDGRERDLEKGSAQKEKRSWIMHSVRSGRSRRSAGADDYTVPDSGTGTPAASNVRDNTKKVKRNDYEQVGADQSSGEESDPSALAPAPAPDTPPKRSKSSSSSKKSAGDPEKRHSSRSSGSGRSSKRGKSHKHHSRTASGNLRPLVLSSSQQPQPDKKRQCLSTRMRWFLGALVAILLIAIIIGAVVASTNKSTASDGSLSGNSTSDNSTSANSTLSGSRSMSHTGSATSGKGASLTSTGNYADSESSSSADNGFYTASTKTGSKTSGYGDYQSSTTDGAYGDWSTGTLTGTSAPTTTRSTTPFTLADGDTSSSGGYGDFTNTQTTDDLGLGTSAPTQTSSASHGSGQDQNSTQTGQQGITQPSGQSQPQQTATSQAFGQPGTSQPVQTGASSSQQFSNPFSSQGQQQGGSYTATQSGVSSPGQGYPLSQSSGDFMSIQTVPNPSGTQQPGQGQSMSMSQGGIPTPSLTNDYGLTPTQTNPYGVTSPTSQPTSPQTTTIPGGQITPGTNTNASETYNGRATWFESSQHLSACETVFSDTDMVAALQPELYGDNGTVSVFCGARINVYNPLTAATISVIIQDNCPLCQGSLALDLSKAAFQQLGLLDTGVLNVTWWWDNSSMIALMPADVADDVAQKNPSILPATVGPEGYNTQNQQQQGASTYNDGTWDGVTTIQNDPWGVAASASIAANGQQGQQQQQQGQGQQQQQQQQPQGQYQQQQGLVATPTSTLTSSPTAMYGSTDNAADYY